MSKWLDVGAVATLLVVLYAVIGGVLVIVSAVGSVEPELRLTFNAYLESMAVAAAGLAVGRGLAVRRAR